MQLWATHAMNVTLATKNKSKNQTNNTVEVARKCILAEKSFANVYRLPFSNTTAHGTANMHIHPDFWACFFDFPTAHKKKHQS